MGGEGKASPEAKAASTRFQNSVASPFQPSGAMVNTRAPYRYSCLKGPWLNQEGLLFRLRLVTK